jgi:mono/diheme cytochrome c family protein
MLLALSVLVLGCNQQMAQQPSYRPFAPSDLFADGSSARPIPPDTVAQNAPIADPRETTGKSADGQDLRDIPLPVTRDLVLRGQSRFNIFCAPCHGQAGYGDGVIVERGFTPPPSFHTDTLRNAPAGHYFDVVTHGFGAMPSYAPQVPPDDRWAIIAYIRALQRSQHATVGDVPADQRPVLESTQP